jgi:hypothetical protein
MAVRGNSHVLLPGGDRVKSVSGATVGGPLLLGSGEQKTKLPAVQWSPARATVRPLNGGASFAPVGVHIGLRLIREHSANGRAEWSSYSFSYSFLLSIW